MFLVKITIKKGSKKLNKKPPNLLLVFALTINVKKPMIPIKTKLSASKKVRLLVYFRYYFFPAYCRSSLNPVDQFLKHHILNGVFSL